MSKVIVNKSELKSVHSYYVTQDLAEKLEVISQKNPAHSVSAIVEFCCRKVLKMNLETLKIKDIKI